jgi:hypothetical protein
MPFVVQALFLHERLILGALDSLEQAKLRARIERAKGMSFLDDVAKSAALEAFVPQIMQGAQEVSVGVLKDSLQVGQLATLSQDFYFRRPAGERGSFRAKLASDRAITVEGGFSRERLVGMTGLVEASGHKRLTMLGYVRSLKLDGASPQIGLNPLFFGWRMLGPEIGPLGVLDDRRELSPWAIDQFAEARGKRASEKDRLRVGKMKESEVKRAFAEVIGEPYVPKDWGGERSDLCSSRLTIDGEQISAAFAFKGPAEPGTLHISGMGTNGDQALKLAEEPADVLIVQHHAAIAADVRHLLSAIARQHGKRFVVIDGESTAVILRTYGKLGAPPSSPSQQRARPPKPPARAFRSS